MPATSDVVRAGHDLFGWIGRHGLAVVGPTLEEHLVDDDGRGGTVLEIPVRPAPGRVSGP
ncbi:hypothetical protein [Myceligenerans pegani]|uniref:Uncharacterized protein n=1 Tax=Myceligenerans pegani TaxID=2776917 RepID=A0ABR9N4H9_9MICO|nr:hypothetical protein [Myceligenerans sp. TRM 65318]MBE1878076.1 hypothetical protein [Myceligenerans sp. TRM 65318]MBE3020347.1 hypothetical protein [Myceligenerans sp. TRM 65318]